MFSPFLLRDGFNQWWQNSIIANSKKRWTMRVHSNSCYHLLIKPMVFVTAIIPMQHIEALCNACTDRYASYGNNSLHSSFSLTTFPPASPSLSRLPCPQWQIWWHYCRQQHDTSNAVAVSLHPGQQVVWVSNPLRKPDWLWERILLASFYAGCLYFLFLITVFEFRIIFVF